MDTTAWNDPLPQDSPEDQLDRDLHSLLSLARSLAESPMLHVTLRLHMESVARAIAGCRHCARPLGDVHAFDCVTFGNWVLSIDLNWTTETALARSNAHEEARF